MKKETTFILVVPALILLGLGVAWGATGQATAQTDNSDASLNLASTLSFLNWLSYLTSAKNSTLSTKLVLFSSKKTIPSQLLQKLRPHIVLATLHTPDAPGAVDRIILAGINQTQVKPSVRSKDWPQSY